MHAALIRKFQILAIVALAIAPNACKRAKAQADADTLGASDPSAAAAIAEEAYIYGYPLVSVELTRRIMTNTVRPQGPHAPMGQLANMRTYPSPSMHDVTTPNANTLYSSAFIDVGKEPYVFSLPDENGRYYLMQMLDAWTEVFEVPGTRTTGTGPQTYLITGPRWTGSIPSGMTEYRSPTSTVWIIGRTFAQQTPADLAAVHKLQDQYKLVPLSAWGKPYTPPPGRVDRTVDMKTPVRDQIAKMPAKQYFQLMANLMVDNPPTPSDAPLVAKMATIGLAPGEPFDGSKLDAAVLAAVPTAAFERIAQAETSKQPVNGWIYDKDVGNYGTNYLNRAMVAAFGLGANRAADAIYPTTKVDDAGNPLTGKQKYVLHFSKNDLPPAKAFWSVTMYNDQLFFVKNPINRYQISPKQSPVKYNPDGSLDLYVQHDSPGADRQENWLPAPAGNFVLVMRLYWPEQSALSGSWKPPAVTAQQVTASAK